MAKYLGRDPLAMRIADALLASNSETALDRARATRDRYLHAGNIVQTDLFVAVCTIIGLRDATVARPLTRTMRDQMPPRALMLCDGPLAEGVGT